jgi:NTE family protein
MDDGVATRGRPMAAAMQEAKTINLALQGGGAHGAFAWGVLDRLLEDERIVFEGISATSAGAMNATVLASGLASGGRDGARTALATFWRKISEAAALGPLQPTWYDRITGNRSMDSNPAFVLFDMMSRLLSPYQFNPLNNNPLRDVLESVVDFDAVRRQTAIKLFLCATNVRTGKVKIFENREVTSSAVLASGCLPFMFQSVEVDGEAYWDGGYMGNPAIFPLIYGCKSTDVAIVHLNPIERSEIPKTAGDILNRLNEISFNSSLMREMRAIAFVTKLIETDQLKNGNLRRVLIHGIEAEERMKGFGVASKLNADWEFLQELHALGRRVAQTWIEEKFDALGRRSTVDIHQKYL